MAMKPPMVSATTAIASAEAEQLSNSRPWKSTIERSDAASVTGTRLAETSLAVATSYGNPAAARRLRATHRRLVNFFARLFIVFLVFCASIPMWPLELQCALLPRAGC